MQKGESYPEEFKQIKDSIQQILEAEMADHLGYAKHSADGNNTGNSRNGYSKKTIRTKYGPNNINISRGRNKKPLWWT